MTLTAPEPPVTGVAGIVHIFGRRAAPTGSEVTAGEQLGRKRPTGCRRRSTDDESESDGEQ
jgi:hypothetical protein